MKKIELLSIRETAKKYGLSETLLREMERNGELPGIYRGKLGRCKMVNVDLLFEVLEEKSRRCGK